MIALRLFALFIARFTVIIIFTRFTVAVIVFARFAVAVIIFARLAVVVVFPLIVIFAFVVFARLTVAVLLEVPGLAVFTVVIVAIVVFATGTPTAGSRLTVLFHGVLLTFADRRFAGGFRKLLQQKFAHHRIGGRRYFSLLVGRSGNRFRSRSGGNRFRLRDERQVGGQFFGGFRLAFFRGSSLGFGFAAAAFRGCGL